MDYKSIKSKYCSRSEYTKEKECLKKAYRLAVRMIESVPDEQIQKIMKSTDRYAECIWVNLEEREVSFFNSTKDDSIDFCACVGFQTEVKQVLKELKNMNLRLERLTLFMQRNSVKFYMYEPNMDEKLATRKHLERFEAMFGKDLIRHYGDDSFEVSETAFD